MSDLVLRVLPNGQVLARNCKVCGILFGLDKSYYRQHCSYPCKNITRCRSLRERRNEWRKDPVMAAHMRELARKYQAKPEARAKKREYASSWEQRAKRNLYKHTPKGHAGIVEYRKRNRERHRLYSLRYWMEKMSATKLYQQLTGEPCSDPLAARRAFISMGIMPTNRENDNGAYRSGDDGSQAAIMAQGESARAITQDRGAEPAGGS